MSLAITYLFARTQIPLENSVASQSVNQLLVQYLCINIK